MKVKHRDEGKVSILQPKGKFLGGADTGELDEKLYALRGLGRVKIVLDLSETDWMNASGIAILIHHLKKFKEAGGDIKLSGLTRNIEKILVIARLTLVFEVYDDVKSAIASFA